jgi:hypothetical protein
MLADNEPVNDNLSPTGQPCSILHSSTNATVDSTIYTSTFQQTRIAAFIMTSACNRVISAFINSIRMNFLFYKDTK